MMVFLTFVVLSLLACSQGESVIQRHSVQELSLFEKLALSLTDPDFTPSPELFSSKLSEKWWDLTTADGDVPFFFFNLDLPTLALQMGVLGNSIPVPNFDYEFDFCILLVCRRLKYSLKSTTIKNAAQNYMKSELNGNRISLEFNIPDLQIESKDYVFNDTSLITKIQRIWTGATFYLANYTLKFEGDVNYVPDVGVQVDNVRLGFNVDDFRLFVEKGISIRPNGRVDDLGSSTRQIAKYINASWVLSQDWYKKIEPWWMNCFLSNSHESNDCGELTQNKIQRAYFIQLIQTAGIGAFNKLVSGEKLGMTQ